jgi:hypothetical protein
MSSSAAMVPLVPRNWWVTLTVEPERVAARRKV